MTAAPIVNYRKSTANAESLKKIGHEAAFAVLLLHDNGMIAECNEVGVDLFDCSLSMLAWRHVSTLLPQLAEISLIQEDGQINPRLRFLSRLGYHFEAVGMNDKYFFCELFFIAVEHRGRHYLRIIVRPIEQEAPAYIH